MTEAISTSDRDTYLRAASQGVKLYLAVYNPASVLECSLDGAPTYPAATLNVDNITSGSVGAALAGYTLEVWDSAGAARKGWVRLRADGAGNTLYIAECGEGYIPFADNDLLRVYPVFRPVAKYHRWNGSAWDVDYDVAYSGQNATYGPLARVGGPAVGFRDEVSGECTLNFVGERSAAYTPGNSIGSYAWSFPEGLSDMSAGTATVPVAATFSDPHPGGALFSLTVIENISGASHTAVNVLWTFDRSGANAPYRVLAANVESTLGVGGRATVYVYGQIADADLRPDAYVVLFCESFYGGVEAYLGGTHPYRANILLAGYVVGEVQVVTGSSPQQVYTRLEIATVDEVLRRMAAYPVMMDDSATTPTTWEQFVDLDVDAAALHWYKYRAQIPHDLNLSHFLGRSSNNRVYYLDLPDGNLWEQFEYLGPDTIAGMVGCSMTSDLYLDANHQLTPEVYRWLLTPALRIEAGRDTRDELEIDVNVYHESAQENGSGVAGAAPLFARGPDDPKGYMGVVSDQPPGFAPLNQGVLNCMTGKLRDYKNRAEKSLRIPLAYFVNLDANPQTLLNVTIPQAYHPRGSAAWSAGRNVVLTRVSHEFRDDLLALTTIEVEPEIPDGVNAVSVYVPQEPVVQYSDYAPSDFSAYADEPLFGEPIDSAYGGEALAATDVGVFATYNLRAAFDNQAVAWEPRSLGIPAGCLCGNMRIWRFAPTANQWTAFLLVWDPANPTGGNGGIYRNSDVWNPGSAWTRVYSDADFVAAVPGSTSATLYPGIFFSLQIVGTWIYAWALYRIGGTVYQRVVRSSDGINWTVAANPHSADAAGNAGSNGALVASAAQDGYLYDGGQVSGNCYLRRSTDRGDTWSDLYNFGAGVLIAALNVPYQGNSSDQLLFASLQGGSYSFYRSTDGGATMTAQSLPGGYGQVYDIHSYTLDSNIISLACSSSMVVVSTNAAGGSPSWSAVTSLPWAARYLFGWPTDPLWLAATRNGGLNIALTEDRGATAWHDATGNLADFGAQYTYYFIPRSF